LGHVGGRDVFRKYLHKPVGGLGGRGRGGGRHSDSRRVSTILGAPAPPGDRGPSGPWAALGAKQRAHLPVQLFFQWPRARGRGPPGHGGGGRGPKGGPRGGARGGGGRKNRTGQFSPRGGKGGSHRRGSFCRKGAIFLNGGGTRGETRGPGLILLSGNRLHRAGASPGWGAFGAGGGGGATICPDGGGGGRFRGGGKRGGFFSPGPVLGKGGAGAFCFWSGPRGELQARNNLDSGGGNPPTGGGGPARATTGGLRPGGERVFFVSVGRGGGGGAGAETCGKGGGRVFHFNLKPGFRGVGGVQKPKTVREKRQVGHPRRGGFLRALFFSFAANPPAVSPRGPKKTPATGDKTKPPCWGRGSPFLGPPKRGRIFSARRYVGKPGGTFSNGPGGMFTGTLPHAGVFFAGGGPTPKTLCFQWGGRARGITHRGPIKLPGGQGAPAGCRGDGWKGDRISPAPRETVMGFFPPRGAGRRGKPPFGANRRMGGFGDRLGRGGGGRFLWPVPFPARAPHNQGAKKRRNRGGRDPGRP